MPIYEYRRPDGTTFDLLQAFSDEPLTEDPESGVPVERVLHAPAVHFKGKGFYNTDYGKRSRQRDSSAEKSAGADGSGAGGEGGGSAGGEGGGSSGSDSSGSDSAKGSSAENGTKPASAAKDGKAVSKNS